MPFFPRANVLFESLVSTAQTMSSQTSFENIKTNYCMRMFAMLDVELSGGTIPLGDWRGHWPHGRGQHGSETFWADSTFLHGFSIFYVSSQGFAADG